MSILFWISVAIIIYTYIGYGILIYALTKVKKQRNLMNELSEKEPPEVTIVIAAYNEARFIENKIENTLGLDYPKEKLKLFVVTDGSDDGTPDLVKKYPTVRLFHEPERKGKIHAVNRVMTEVESPITIFSDANTILNKKAVLNIMRHYHDESVGGVAGEKRVVKTGRDNATSGEGLYWRYESFLKRKDSELHSIVGAAGELFSLRTKLYEAPPQNMIIEDFYISLQVVAKGFRFVYEPEACATETGSASISDEWKRKVRISAGGFQAIVKLAGLLNPFRFGVVTFQYISHRVLRWTLAPLSLFTALISNCILVFQKIPPYNFLFWAQLIFYFAALLGYLYRDRKISLKGFFVPFYFTVMNASVFAGFIRFLRGNQSVVWEKSERA